MEKLKQEIDLDNIIFDFAIDRGGTFTDIFCQISDKNNNKIPRHQFVYKLLSEDQEYGDGPKEGIRRIIEFYIKQQISLNQKIPSRYINSLRMGTTVATNALLERKGVRTALVVTKGFRDLLSIGNQTRPLIFDITMKRPEKIFETVLEIDERVRILKSDEIQENNKNYFTNQQGEIIEILKQIDEQEVKQNLMELKNKGIEAVSIVLMHSPSYPEHEIRLGKIAQEVGFEQVSLSSQIIPLIKIVPRGYTATLDAYINPYIQRYIANFVKGFDEDIKNIKIFFMQSDGGLSSLLGFRGSKSILSGPAGGVIGYGLTSSFLLSDKTLKGIIGFDMGGTSTDVSRYDGKQHDHIFDAQIAGVTIQTPHLDINTVAAGGGSRLFYENHKFKVGPESAGATPGPVCYGKEGYLAITDANLILGRIIPEYFPKIFGHSKNKQLFLDETIIEFQKITEQINKDNNSNKSIQEVAFGFIKVANESMCRPIRSITQGKGTDPRFHILSIFGGAGGQHACSIAKQLGIKKIFIHNYAGILSAYGMAKANVVEDGQMPYSCVFEEGQIPKYNELLQQISESNETKLINQGFNKQEIVHEWFLSMKYDGTDTNLTIQRPENEDYRKQFNDNHFQQFGFNLHNRTLKLDFIRVRSKANKDYSTITDSEIFDSYIEQEDIAIIGKHKTYFQNYQGQLQAFETNIYQMEVLAPSSRIRGPAIMLNQTSTNVIEPGWVCIVTKERNLIIVIDDKDQQLVQEQQLKYQNQQQKQEIICDPIELSIFGNRFMSIAEQMGKTLQSTSCSTNIKERLDFSCALFAPDGSLVANAPHLPVHLGSMTEAVRYQIKYLGDSWKQDEVIITNHPAAGGSHLPDITIITPVYDQNKAIFYVANRGHHADIGGINPGSMPPFSKSLDDEGIAIKSFKIVSNGQFKEQELIELLTNPGQNKIGTRTLNDNVSDIKAQVAANQKGVKLLRELIEEYGLAIVHAYMQFIQENAEECVRSMLVNISLQNQMKEVDTIKEIEYMDDGSQIQLCLTIDRKQRSALFDFTGTGYQVLQNTNCPKSVTQSAIIYCLRCLINSEIPLNQGCMKPITCFIPENSLLNPTEDAPIVGGNVLTSQRITDVILKAFKACAASQGCMNNFTFGNSKFGYYETIAGGGGAGEGYDGQSGVQCHMTNTRITDPEILERRYPVLLKQFVLRDDSGGKGKYIGGNGVIREVQFLENMTVSILSERRVYEPFGMFGGENGKRGINLYISQNGQKIINLGGKNTLQVNKDDIIVIQTPGGGGWGKYSERQDQQQNKKNNKIEELPNFGSEAKYQQKQYTV